MSRRSWGPVRVSGEDGREYEIDVDGRVYRVSRSGRRRSGRRRVRNPAEREAVLRVAAAQVSGGGS